VIYALMTAETGVQPATEFQAELVPKGLSAVELSDLTSR